MRARAFAAPALALALVAGVTGCGKSSHNTVKPAAGGAKGKITVAAFNFGESELLANMFADVLNKAGYNASVKALTNREVVEPALEAGQVDIVPEYAATLTEFLNTKDNGANATPKASSDLNATVSALKAEATKHHFAVGDPSQAADENAFAVTQDFASKNHLSKLSDLSSFKGKLVLGGPPECPKRPFCEPGLQKTYGIHFSGFKALDAGGPLTKQGIKRGLVQIGLVFSSDAGIAALNLKVLDDDKHLQNTDNIIPAVDDKWNKPEVLAALKKVTDALTTDELVTLNKSIDIDHKDPSSVAKDFLTQKGLV